MKTILTTFACLLLYTCLYCQNVGIGLTNPYKARLEVATGNTTVGLFGTTSTGISFQQNWPTIGFNQYRDSANTPRYIGSGFGIINYLDPNSGNMYWNGLNQGTADNVTSAEIPRMSLLSNGSLGVGTGTPRGAFDVATNGNIYLNSSPQFGVSQYLFAPGATIFGPWSGGDITYLHAQRLSGSGNMNMQIRTTNGGALHDALYINRDGKVAINDNNATHSLSINQVGHTGIKLMMPDLQYIHWEILSDTYDPTPGSESACLEWKYNGPAIKGWFRPTTGEYTANSDVRLKKNIELMHPVLHKIMQMRPSTYEFINDNPRHEKSFGFIAQDLKKIFPEVVSIIPGHIDSLTGKGLLNQHGITYSTISVLAIKAVQEQQQEIVQQGKEINQLKKEIEILKAIVSKKTIRK